MRFRYLEAEVSGRPTAEAGNWVPGKGICVFLAGWHGGAATRIRVGTWQLYSKIWYGLRTLRHASIHSNRVGLPWPLRDRRANRASFSVVKLLKLLPFPDPDRSVTLWASTPHNPGDDFMPVTPADFGLATAHPLFCRDRSFPAMCKRITGAGELETLIGCAFAANVFHVVGVTPWLVGLSLARRTDRARIAG